MTSRSSRVGSSSHHNVRWWRRFTALPDGAEHVLPLVKDVLVVRLSLPLVALALEDFAALLGARFELLPDARRCPDMDRKGRRRPGSRHGSMGQLVPRGLVERRLAERRALPLLSRLALPADFLCPMRGHERDVESWSESKHLSRRTRRLLAAIVLRARALPEPHQARAGISPAPSRNRKSHQRTTSDPQRSSPLHRHPIPRIHRRLVGAARMRLGAPGAERIDGSGIAARVAWQDVVLGRAAQFVGDRCVRKLPPTSVWWHGSAG